MCNFKTVIGILIESPFYWELVLTERLALVNRIISYVSNGDGSSSEEALLCV